MLETIVYFINAYFSVTYVTSSLLLHINIELRMFKHLKATLQPMIYRVVRNKAFIFKIKGATSL